MSDVQVTALLLDVRATLAFMADRRSRIEHGLTVANAVAIDRVERMATSTVSQIGTRLGRDFGQVHASSLGEQVEQYLEKRESSLRLVGKPVAGEAEDRIDNALRLEGEQPPPPGSGVVAVRSCT